MRPMFQFRFLPLTILVILAVGALAAALIWPHWSFFFACCFVAFAALVAVGLRDLTQPHHAVLRNYPIAARLRFLLAPVRPEMQPYFIEGEKDGAPFARAQRAIVHSRTTNEGDKRPFGTMLDVYQPQYEWLHHSLIPAPALSVAEMRVQIGSYSASLLNISAMSYGALSPNAIRALNKGARLGGFFHDTGEGGVSPYHRERGGDLVWQIGSGYFGCRTPEGGFDPARFAETAVDPQIKMIEVKLSQGATPGHGGILPAAKVTKEIALIRGIPMGRDCLSPARHSAFSTPIELLQFIAQLRDLSGGKPTGFKLCIGHEWEFMALCKAMFETGIAPDFIVIDGNEGGTGAAPVELMDHVGMPLHDGLSFAHNALVGAGLRDRVKLGAAGKITSAFDMAKIMALGADWCNVARGFMFAVGCMQAQSCHTGACPTGVTSQDPLRNRALVVDDKAERARNFHHNTLQALSELVAAAGLPHPNKLRPHHFQRRITSDKVVSFADQYEQLAPGILLTSPDSSARYGAAWNLAQSNSFARAS